MASVVEISRFIEANVEGRLNRKRKCMPWKNM
jgi:hypothetical protein